MFLNDKVNFQKYIENKLEEAKFNKSYYFVSWEMPKAFNGILSNNYALFMSLQSKIPEECIYTEPDDYGLEERPHVTIMYGLKEDPNDLLERHSFYGDEFNITIGDIKSFRNNSKEPYDVLILEILDTDGGFEEIHSLLKSNLENDWKYDDYKPHMTLAYVKPNTCLNLEGIDHPLKNKRITVESITHTDPEEV